MLLHDQTITHFRTAKAIQAPIAMRHVRRAIRKAREFAQQCYRETEQRKRWRLMFEAAHAVPNTLIAVTFVKGTSQELRTMLCQPTEPGCDITRRYVTVWDCLAGGYRRVNLDGIVKLTLEAGHRSKQN